MASSSLGQMSATLIQRSKTLLNKDLQRICRAEGVATSGVKSQLQGRVTDLINRAVLNNDHALFNRLQHHISNGPGAPAADYSTYPSRTATSSSPSMPNGRGGMANGYQRSPYGGYQTPAQPARPQYFFKESPFFEIRDMLLNNITLDTSPSHRQSVNKHLTLNDAQSARLRSDPTLRVLLFCAVEQPLAPFTRLDITFPSQIEVRVNQDEVKANYKGLKNKPGSTRPADITDLLRITPANYRNSIGITYALTQKASDHQKYNVFIYMVRKFSVDELVKQIQNRSVITKDSVLREMRKKADDPDIEVGSSVMSLKDPISTLKISTPCRSTVCSHNRCFDGESFLQLQEQAPTWTCPICNKTISFQSLAVDEYVQDILSNVSRSTDQVTVEPDGQWRNEKEPPATNRKSNGSAYGYNYDEEEDESEEELVEIPDYRLSAIKSEAAPTPQSLPSIRTPPAPSREASSAPRTGSKRSSEVIDLTLSDDDEPRPKKVAYSTPNSAPDRMRQYQLPSYSSMHSRPDGVRMDPPLAQSRHSYGTYREPQSHSHTSFPGQGTSAYPAYIDSSP
ncbi:E3 SUMO-protein ligase pli1 [Didymosphaeria variabile]|uniref:E3 SUMO-protein ligase pli1 n=1 Tax=Didymosphaeria variabile TaxID=1932322 RepID=A0A9W8XM03_9PLEO|nr:E3 SUMO-protein ligase pli1 [Didymosphaeria variabile]KAJ4354004.1 E3 SUMO-protein ligase pli1 [Didymosphaeria variabile]